MMTVTGVVLGGLVRLVTVVDVVGLTVVVDVVDGGGAVAAAPGTAAASTPAPWVAMTGLAAGTLAGRTAGGQLEPSLIDRFYGPSAPYWSD